MTSDSRANYGDSAGLHRNSRPDQDTQALIPATPERLRAPLIAVFIWPLIKRAGPPPACLCSNTRHEPQRGPVMRLADAGHFGFSRSEPRYDCAAACRLLSTADQNGPRTPAIAIPESLAHEKAATVVVRRISVGIPIAVATDACHTPPIRPMPTIVRPPRATPIDATISGTVETATSQCSGRRYESDRDNRIQGYQGFTHRRSLPLHRVDRSITPFVEDCPR